MIANPQHKDGPTRGLSEPDAASQQNVGDGKSIHRAASGGKGASTLPPVRSARAGVVQQVLRQCGAFPLRMSRTDRALWGSRGLSLAHLDVAVSDLVEAGVARLDVSPGGIWVELVEDGGAQ